MGTPFITLLEPNPAVGHHYDRKLPPGAPQHASVPQTFLDAMEVRHAVFVGEQGVPPEFEFDADDPRSCHWVVYASVNQAVSPKTGGGDGVATSGTSGVPADRRQSVTRSVPVGTLRLVPFPHPPHPVHEARYVDGKLVNTDELSGTKQQQEKQQASTAAASAVSAATATAAKADTEHRGPPPATPNPLAPTPGDEKASSNGNDPSFPFPATASSPTTASATIGTFAPDRPTDLHDGREPYIKLGRLAVLPEFRGHGVARLLVNTALAWMAGHKTYFNPSIAVVGLGNLGDHAGRPTEAGDAPRWSGLVCVHAQEGVVGFWGSTGFEVDKGMGKWYEEDIPHRGMFQRLPVV